MPRARAGGNARRWRLPACSRIVPAMDDTCRIDVWLWRARFFKTRGMAARFVEEGRVRLLRQGSEVRLDKPRRTIRAGERLVFVLGGRVTELTILACGERRGPAEEARGLYALAPAS